MSVTINPRSKRRSTGRKPLGSEASWEDEDTKVIPPETMAQIRESNANLAAAAEGMDEDGETMPIPVTPRVQTRPLGSRHHRVCLSVNGGSDNER